MELLETPHDVAMELVVKHDGDHRAAEIEAWKLRDAHGRDSAYGRLLARAAFEIADLYHDVDWKNDDKQYASTVPVFERRPAQ